MAIAPTPSLINDYRMRVTELQDALKDGDVSEIKGRSEKLVGMFQNPAQVQGQSVDPAAYIGQAKNDVDTLRKASQVQGLDAGTQSSLKNWLEQGQSRSPNADKFSQPATQSVAERAEAAHAQVGDKTPASAAQNAKPEGQPKSPQQDVLDSAIRTMTHAAEGPGRDAHFALAEGLMANYSDDPKAALASLNELKAATAGNAEVAKGFGSKDFRDSMAVMLNLPTDARTNTAIRNYASAHKMKPSAARAELKEKIAESLKGAHPQLKEATEVLGSQSGNSPLDTIEAAAKAGHPTAIGFKEQVASGAIDPKSSEGQMLASVVARQIEDVGEREDVAGMPGAPANAVSMEEIKAGIKGYSPNMAHPEIQALPAEVKMMMKSGKPEALWVGKQIESGAGLSIQDILPLSRVAMSPQAVFSIPTKELNAIPEGMRGSVRELQASKEQYYRSAEKDSNELLGIINSGMPIETIIMLVMMTICERSEEKMKYKLKELAVAEQFEARQINTGSLGLNIKSKQIATQELQAAQTAHKQMFDMLSAVMRVMQDMASTPIRNIR